MASFRFHPSSPRPGRTPAPGLKHKSLLDTYETEWFRGNPSEPRLPEGAMPRGLSPVETHQAHRALAGRMLRQEIYAEDGTPKQDKPYAVTQQSWSVRRLQPTSDAPYASFLTIPAETLTIQYERSTQSPRMSHEMAVKVDALGYVQESASIAYGHPAGADYTEQEKSWVAATQSKLFHHVGDTDWYRHGVPLSARSWELGSDLAPAATIFTIDEVRRALATQTEVAFDVTPAAIDKPALIHTRALLEERRLRPAPIRRHRIPRPPLPKLRQSLHRGHAHRRPWRQG